MKTYRLYQVDAFTTKAEVGGYAVVAFETEMEL